MAGKINETTEKLNTKSKAFNKAKKDYTAFLELTDTGTEGLNCERACEKANELLPLLKKTNLENLGDQIAELKESVIALRVRARQFEPRDPSSNKPKCKEQFGVLTAAADGYKKAVDDLDKTFKELQTAINESQPKFDSLAKIINSVFDVISSGGNPFIEVHTLRVDDDAKEVEFTIARKNLRVADSQEVAFNTKPTFQVGESRLSLSAGFGFSTINEIKIIRQASLIPGAGGTQTLGNRFGFENRSRFRPSGLLLLNAHLLRFGIFDNNDTTLAFSGGLVLSQRSSANTSGSGLATEFIAGPSLGFVNNRMFLTLGFHAARVEQLGGGFNIGDPVPANLADPIPVEKNWRNGLMFSITYRIRPR